MNISIEKTKVLHVRTQDKTSPTTTDQALKICKFTCPHHMCGHRFLTKHGMLVHAGRCDHRNVYAMDGIVDHKGPPKSRKYRVRWAGYSEKDDTWEPRANVHPSEVTKYERSMNIYDEECQHRCLICNLPCKSDRGRKIHESRMHKGKKTDDIDKHVLGKV